VSSLTLNKKIPRLRFRGFSDEWIAIGLKDVGGKGQYGLGVAAKNFDGVNKYLRITDIDEETRKIDSDNLTSPSGVLEDGYLLKPGDIVFTRTGASTGKTYLYDINDGRLYFAGFLIRFRLKRATPYFVYAQTLRRQYDTWVVRMSARSGQPGINAEEYGNFIFYAPGLTEQKKIAGFLGVVDDKISSLKSKKSALEKYKKGAMQQIFSQKIRFKPENGKDYPGWQEKKLGEVCVIKSGSSKSMHIDESGDNVIVDMGAISSVGRLIESKRTKFQGDYLSPRDLVMAKDDIGGGNIIGKVVCIPSENKYVLGDHVYRITPRRVLTKYLYYVVNSWSINRSFRAKANGTAQIGITNGTVNNQLVDIPAIGEQQKIADFLTSLDDKINLTERKLEKAKLFKKALLQQMFV